MQEPTRNRTTTHWSALAALGVLGSMIWAFQARLALLHSSPYPLGIDGYFYPLQVRALLTDGALHYPASPVITWFMAPFAAVTDPIAGAKYGAALAGALAPLPAYLLGRRLGRSRAAGLLAATLIATSAQSFYLCTEFVKNSLGVSAALGYLCALLWALEQQRVRRARWLIAAALLLVTALTHKLALILALALGMPPLYRWWRGCAADTRPSVRVAAIAIGGLIGAFAVLGALAPERFPAARDLALVSDLLSGSLRPSLPTLHVPGSPPLVFQYEVAIAGALALLLLVARRLRWLRNDDGLSDTSPGESPAVALASGALALALLVCIPILDVSEPQGLGFRLRLMSFVPLMLCAAALAGRLCARLQPVHRTALLIPFALAFLIARPTGTDEGVVRVHPAMQTAMRAIDSAVPPGDIVIVPERHLMFMATWYGHRESRLRPPAASPSIQLDRYWRLLPLAHITAELARALDDSGHLGPTGRTDGRLDSQLGEHTREHLRIRNLHPAHPRGLLLIHEPSWQRLLSLLPTDQRAQYRHWHTL